MCRWCAQEDEVEKSKVNSAEKKTSMQKKEQQTETTRKNGVEETEAKSAKKSKKAKKQKKNGSEEEQEEAEEDQQEKKKSKKKAKKQQQSEEQEEAEEEKNKNSKKKAKKNKKSKQQDQTQDTTGLCNLLGDTLQGSNGTVLTSDAMDGKKAVALYFSAHWCPPCRAFTPQLASWYTEHLADQGLEIVFVSSDHNQAEFDEYFNEMPWLCLDYEDREQAESLSNQFKLRSIPSLVIVGTDGSIINKDGRTAISKDPTGQLLPWKPPSLRQILRGAAAVAHNGESTCLSKFVGSNKVTAFYFSAHWCPPCRALTPQLASWYTKHLFLKGLGVVFVSWDHEQAEFDEYFSEMPWLSLEYSDQARKEVLNELFGVTSIPSLVLVDSDGFVIVKDGIDTLQNDPTGSMFPWIPNPVLDARTGHSCLDSVPTVIAFCDGCDQATQKAVEAAMTPIAEQMKREAQAASEEEPRVAFMIGTRSEGMVPHLRQMFKMEPVAHASQPQLFLCDIMDNGGYYKGPTGTVTAEQVTDFVKLYTTQKLERLQL